MPALMLAVVIGLSWFIYSIRDQTDVLIRFGYPGVFVLSILANATLILPAPGLALVFGAGTLGLSPIGAGLAAGLGSTLGELSGYLAGYSGSVVVENRSVYERVRGWMTRYGPIVIGVLAFIPNPFFDAAGAIAGALKLPIWQFLLFTAMGKTAKMMLVAYAGAGALDWLPGLRDVFRPTGL
jgi:membrane protein YqaA with SNARE-associated domain